jgi:hypothetical protein
VELGRRARRSQEATVEEDMGVEQANGHVDCDERATCRGYPGQLGGQEEV